MTRVTLALIVIAAACDMKPADDKAAAPGRSRAMDPSGQPGSAMGTTKMDAGAAASPPPAIDAAVAAEPPPPIDAAPDPLEDLAKRYEACIDAADRCGWKLRTDKRYDVGFLLVTKDRLFAVLRLGGTTLGHAVEVDAKGEFVRPRSFDRTRGTAQGGFPRKVVRLAKGDAVEPANLAAFAKLHKRAKPARAAGDYVAGIERKELVVHRFEDGKSVESWTFE